jgi:hypothetical protein
MSHLVMLHDKNGPLLTKPITAPHPAGAIIEAFTGIPKDEVYRQYGMSDSHIVEFKTERPPSYIKIERVG